MNLKDFTLIFIFITLALFTVFFVKTEVSQQFLNESKVEKNYTSSSALDSSGSTVALMEKYDYDLDSNIFSNEEIRKDVIESMESSYANNYGLSQKNKGYLLNYTPLIAFIDNDGFYITHNRKILKNGYNEITRVTTPIHMWTSNDVNNKFIFRYTLGSNITAIDQENELIYSGDRRKVYELIEKWIVDDAAGPNTLSATDEMQYKEAIAFLIDDNQFESAKANVIINSITNALEYYVNAYNERNASNFIKYEVYLPFSKGQDWSRYIENPCVITFFQGVQKASSLGEFTIYSMAGGEIKESPKYFITEEDITDESGAPTGRTQLFYHSFDSDCDHTGITKFYYSMEECAKQGALPDPNCLSN